MNRKINRRKENGITLVALITTIVVILILTGIALSFVLSKNGIITKSKYAGKTYQNKINEEEQIIEDYEDMMDSYSDEKLNVNAEILMISDTEAVINITVNEGYDEALYEYIIDNKVVSKTKSTNYIKEGVKIDKDYNIIVMAFEKNGKVHKYQKTLSEKNEPIGVYGIIGDKTKLSEYGLSYTYKGNAEYKYTDIYNLGMGSRSGINTNTYTLTIDYPILISKIGEGKYKGIYANFWQKVWTHSNAYTSTCESEIIINYTDGTNNVAKTELTSATNTTVNGNKSAILLFDDKKKIANIKLIIHEYDSNCGDSHGTVKEILLLR